MHSQAADIGARLDRIVNLYGKLDELLDKLPVDLPAAIREKIKKAFFANQDMANLIDGIRNRRPPRFILIGRTGVGKSSLINAMVGRHLAKVSDVTIGTTSAARYTYKSLGKTLFEVIDTRGLAESIASSAEHTTEAQLLNTIASFHPDAILFLSRCKERAHLDKDAALLRSISSTIGSAVPIVALLTQADEMEPSRHKRPSEYSQKKLENIADAEAQLKDILKAQQITPLAVLAVSAYIEWNHPDPTLVDPTEWPTLRIEFDGRYNINRLLDLLEESINLRAGIFLMLATRVDQVARKISERLTRIFATAAMAIGATPIPLSDIYILLALQAVLIMMISYLAGQDVSYESAKKMLMSLGGAGIAGLAFRTLAQQAAKLLNLILPSAGSFVSAGVAGAGTYAMGQGAIAYYYDRVSDQALLDVVSKARDEFKPEEP
jgi:uncharacterized protein (DUF697 family)/predicted GTPase